MNKILIGAALIILELVLFSFGAVLRPLLEGKGALGGLGVALVLGVPFYWFLETIKWMRGKDVAIGTLKITAAIYTVVVGGFFLVVGGHGSTPQPQPQPKSGLQSAERISLLCFAADSWIDRKTGESLRDGETGNDEIRVEITGKGVEVSWKELGIKMGHHTAAIDKDRILVEWAPQEASDTNSMIVQSTLRIERVSGAFELSYRTITKDSDKVGSWKGHCGVKPTETGK